MSRISAGLKKTIAEIERLADGSDDDQKKACKELLQKKIFPYAKFKTGIPVSVIPDLLPTIIKFLEFNDHVLQEEGARFINCITDTPDEKTHTKLVIDAGVIPKFKNLLSSTNTDVLISTLAALVNITHDFPQNFVEDEILQSIIHYLKYENPKISYEAAKCMTNILQTSEHVPAMFEADGVKPLIKILDSKNDNVIEWALKALLNITSCNNQCCQRVLDLGGLKSLKKLCDRLFVGGKKSKSNCEADLKNLRERKAILLAIKISAIEFFEIVTSYGEAEVSLIIEENFIPIILQQIKGGMTPKIKIGSIKVVENIIAAKPDFIPALVQDYDIFSICYSNLGSSNFNLLITTLTAMCNIIEKFEDQDSIRAKIRECGGSTKYTNLCKHSNEEIRQLSTMLYEFVFDFKPDPIAEVSGENNQQKEPEVIELDSEDDDTAVIEAPQTRQRKRPAYTSNNGPLRRSKRFRVSLEQTDTDNTDSSSSDDDDSDNDQNNDFDDHPRSSPAGAAPTESNRHDHSGRQSFVVDDTVADNAPSRLNTKAEPATTPASRQSPELSIAASTNNETDQNEIKPSTVGQLGNQSILSSHNSQAASTNDGNIQNDHSGRQSSFVGDNTVAADGSSRFNPKEEPTLQSYHMPATSSASLQSPDLPIAASTNNGTMPNDIPSKPSPVPKPVTTPTFINQSLPPAVAAINDIIQNNIIEYWRPAEFLIHQYCKNLGIQFNRDNYDEFISKIKLTQITSNSKPANIFQPIDNKSGFGCLSILLIGNEDASSTIRMKIIEKFIDCLVALDKEKIKKFTLSPIMLAEHFETIATWLKCRILVYCNGWKKYGSWETENQMIPLFVLNKKENGYQIVLDIKNNNVF